MLDILIIEPFYGGSHKQLIDMLRDKLSCLEKAFIITMPAKKWHWKARTSALQIAFQIPTDRKFEILFCSSVVSLTELCGLRPDVANIGKKVIYFHENQLVYPIQDEKHRDFQYGYNQITSSLTADVILFNSEFNMKSFLSSISVFLKLIPDFKVKNIDKILIDKCHVLYYPIEKPILKRSYDNLSNICHIVWPHRWEHDKNPDLLFKVLFELKDDNVPFCLSVIGEQFSEVPAIFEVGKKVLKDNIVNWGYLENKSDYFQILNTADLVVSTADHEFYGVAMIEAVLHGCIPICPNKLSYPEIFKEMESSKRSYFYNTDRQLLKILKSFCNSIAKGYRQHDQNGLHWKFLSKFMWSDDMFVKYRNIFSL